MPITDADRDTLRRCLEVAAAGKVFEDPEFQALFGLHRTQVIAILETWPTVDETDPDVDLAVNNTLANLLGYPHGKDLKLLVNADEDELRAILDRWRAV